MPIAEQEASEQIAIDLGDEYEQALTGASQEEIIDLAGKQLVFNKVNILKIMTSLLFLHVRSYQCSVLGCLNSSLCYC